MPTLHTVNKSPFEHGTLDSCLRLAEPGSAILLLENGVIAGLNHTTYAEKLIAALDQHAIFILQPDADARGITQRLIPKLQLISYSGFVDLACTYSKIQAWY